MQKSRFSFAKNLNFKYNVIMKNLFNPIGFTMLAGLLASIPIYAVEVESMKNVSVTQQQKKLTGRVTDSLGPVVGASVAIKGTTSGTITDMDGNFTLDVQVGDEISFFTSASSAANEVFWQNHLLSSMN